MDNKKEHPTIEQYQNFIQSFEQEPSKLQKGTLISEIQQLEKDLKQLCKTDVQLRLEMTLLMKEYTKLQNKFLFDCNLELLETQSQQLNEILAHPIQKPEVFENANYEKINYQKTIQVLCNLNPEFQSSQKHRDSLFILQNTDQFLSMRKNSNEFQNDIEEEEENDNPNNMVSIQNQQIKTQLQPLSPEQKQQRAEEEQNEILDIHQKINAIKEIQQDNGEELQNNIEKVEIIDENIDHIKSDVQITENKLRQGNKWKMQDRKMKISVFFGTMWGAIGGVFKGSSGAVIGGAGGLAAGAAIGQALKTNSKIQ